MSMSVPSERLVRPREARERLAVGKTMFQTEIVAKGRLRFFKIGARSCACKESDLLRLINEMAQGKPLAEPEPIKPRISGRYRGTRAADDGKEQ